MSEVTARIPGQAPVRIDLDEVFHAFMRDTLQQATVSYWRRRADELARIGTPWGDSAAQACRIHARLLAGEFDDE